MSGVQVDLGELALTGHFPTSLSIDIPKAPLQLVYCTHPDCELVQLKHSVDAKLLYGNHYGYQSSLNTSMIEHLEGIAKEVLSLHSGKTSKILDIGCNDGTLLGHFSRLGKQDLYGIDPIANKFKTNLNKLCNYQANCFSGSKLSELTGNDKIDIITAIAVVYDIENPLAFFKEIENHLAEDGLFVIELSFYPYVVRLNSFDVICHEHLTYFGIKQLELMAAHSGFKVHKVSVNTINGGSVRLVLAKEKSHYTKDILGLEKVRYLESATVSNVKHSLQNLGRSMAVKRDQLLNLLHKLSKEGKQIYGYGASTKGNVLLQYYGITNEILTAIVDVNPDKYGAYTPGTKIPIIAEKDCNKAEVDYFLVLPWHFQSVFLEKEKDYLAGGGCFIFPLPEVQVVDEGLAIF